MKTRKTSDGLTTGGFDELTTGGFDELTTGGFDELTTGGFEEPTTDILRLITGGAAYSAISEPRNQPQTVLGLKR
jgi:hypothetical protein